MKKFALIDKVCRRSEPGAVKFNKAYGSFKEETQEMATKCVGRCNGEQIITQVILDLVALTVPAPDVLQVVADNLSLFGVIGGMRAHEETHHTVFDALVPSPIDDLQRRFEHLILLHLFAGIGPFPLELIDAVLHIASRQLYLLHLLLVELRVNAVSFYLSLFLFCFGARAYIS